MMNEKYSLHFMKLYDHEILYNCSKQYFMINIDDVNPLKLKN